MAKPIIFVLDDERTISESVALVLRLYGYEARSFLDPQEALKAIRQSPPDMLLADVELPGMTGIDLAIVLLEENIPTQTLLFSGYPCTSDYVEQAALRGYDFTVLAKPVAPQQLRQLIEESLNKPTA